MRPQTAGTRMKTVSLRVGGRAVPGIVLAFGLALASGPLAAQTSLADYDYENLAFRGFALETGYIFPSRVDRTYTLGLRADLGYLGPGFRIVPNLSYWSSTLKGSEVSKLERKMDALIQDQVQPGPSFTGVDLGSIDWSDLVVGMDGHFVWSVPMGFLTFAGAGASVHFLNGDGMAIGGTFVEDLLDSVRAGFNLHGGLELPFGEPFRLYGEARYEFLEDLRYLELRVGGQIMLTGPEPGEVRSP